MAPSKLFLFPIFIAVIFAGIGVVSAPDVAIPHDGDVDSATLEQLKFKIRALEHQIEEKIREIKDKDKVVVDKEKRIGLLESENVGLKRQVEELRQDLRVKIKENEQLKSRITEADRRASELNSKVDNLHKIIDDKKTKFHSTEQAIKLAEEEMVKAKHEAASKTKELMELHGAWFPPWLAAHFDHCQLLMGKTWEVHGKPTVEQLKQKAMEKKACFEEWATPRVEKAKTKWVPVLKKQWIAIEPHVRTITAKTVEICKTSKETITPHLIQVMDVVNPYLQELWKVSEPYIDRVVAAARRHVDPLHTALKPYMQLAVHTCGKFLESATTYHHHVQEKVQERLEGQELTKPFATKELVWFSASALLALPIIFLMRICSAIFRFN